MGPIEALERSRVVAIRRRLMAPKVAKEASEPRQVVRRYAPSLDQIRAVYIKRQPEATVKVKLAPKPKTPVMEIVDLPTEDKEAATETRREKIRRIIGECAEKHGVLPFEVRGQRRNLPVVHARQEAMFRMQVEMDLSAVAIGRSFNKDHTTVLHAIKAHQKRNPAVVADHKQYLERMRNAAEYSRELAIAAFASGCVNISEVAAVAKISRFKARGLLREAGLLPPEQVTQ